MTSPFTQARDSTAFYFFLPLNQLDIRFHRISLKTTFQIKEAKRHSAVSTETVYIHVSPDAVLHWLYQFYLLPEQLEFCVIQENNVHVKMALL